MDVRCPNCETEYELDEGRMRPGGVTVKCAQCRHVFRVRQQTQEDGSVDKPVIGNDEERSWLIRLADGEIKVCRELATLQRWIVSGHVGKKCEISRTGKTWKTLDQLKELQSFFAIAEEARNAPTPAELAAEGSVVAKAPTFKRPHTISRNADAQTPVPEAGTKFNSEETVEISTEESKRAFEAQQEREQAQHDSETLELSASEAKLAIEAATKKFREEGIENVLPTHDDLTQAETRAIEVNRQPEPKLASAAQPAPRANQPTTRVGRTVPPPAPGSRARTESEARASVSAIAKDPSAISNLDLGAAANEEVEDSIEIDTPVFKPPAAEDTQPIPKQTKALPAVSQGRLPAAARGEGPTQKQANKDAEEQIDSLASRLMGNRERSGPTGGMKRGVPVADVAFAKPNSKEFRDGRFVASDERPDGEKSNGAGRWIVLMSLIVLVGAGASIYFLLFRTPQKTSKSPVVATVKDAAPAESEADGDVGVVVIPAPEEVEALVDAAVNRRESTEITGLLRELNAGEMQGMEFSLARLHNALAQAEIDKDRMQEKTGANSKAREHGQKALKYLYRLGSERQNEGAVLIEIADALRLTGSQSRDVERQLKKAREEVALKGQRAYVTYLLRHRDRRLRDARSALDEALAVENTPRLQLHSALLNFEEKKYEDSLAQVEALLALDSEHGDAAQLLEAVEAAMGGGPSIDADASVAGTPDPPTPTPTPTPDPPAEENYDRLLERADRAAETGNCAAAMRSYDKALDLRPNGVEALTGLGFCHLDARNFASAHARFRAALGISGRYQDALWGVAEAYQQQGLSDKAIAAYRTFIREHPSSLRADMAKRQVERLGGSVVEPQAPDEDSLPDEQVDPEE